MTTPTPSYATDVKPLFRQRDRAAMTFMFDLWEYEDVKANAEDILAVTTAGEMPCDGPWLPEHVDTLRRWIEAGCQP